ncbi:7121_t:CDS:2, partial [Acaulospora morrowiae]
YGKDYKDDLVWMYKMMFPPRYPNIAFIGLIVSAGAIFPVSEMQARYVTSQIKGFIKPLPSPAEMDQCIRDRYERIRKFYVDPSRHSIQAKPLLYLDELSQEIGCYPYAFEIIKKFGLGFWKLITFGLATPIQFRLLGRNSWEGSKEAILLYNKRAA